MIRALRELVLSKRARHLLRPFWKDRTNLKADGDQQTAGGEWLYWISAEIIEI